MTAEQILFLLEILGTISFAVSGAFVAIRAKFDVFGVLVVGGVTCVGGGIMRDILIGKTPPTIFSRTYILAIAIATSLMVFILAYFQCKEFDKIQERIEHINNVFDAIGLAAFTVMGTEIAFVNGLEGNIFLSITLGVLTGVGGGVLRDILTETPPYIFKKHVYALASIFGACLYYLLRILIGTTLLPSAVTIVFIVSIRLLAAKYRWSLPKIEIKKRKEK